MKLLGFLLLALAVPATAQSYPTRPIRLVVPFAPGGGNDILARLLGQHMGRALGQQFVIENRPGAAGSIGARAVAKASPDGYTLLVSPPGPLTINHLLYRDIGYSPQKFAPVSLLAKIPNALVVRKELPAKTMSELVAYGKANPGKLTYGTQGAGSTAHLTSALLEMRAGIKMVHVPYRGAVPALNDIIAGHIDMFFIGTQIALPLVQEGKLRALAVTGKERWKGMPDVPTMQEQGFKDFNVVNWFGAWLPAGAPPEIVARLQAEIARTLQEPDIQKEFDTLGLRSVGSSPEEFASFVAKDAETAREIARRIEGRKK